MAHKRFTEVIDTQKKESLLKDGCIIKELLDDFWMKQRCFEVSIAASRQSQAFDKNSITLKKSQETAANAAKG